MWKERTEKKKFEEGFGEDVKEIYALTQDDVGSCRMKGGCCWTARRIKYTDEDYQVLLRIVQAEAGICDPKGKILVADVIINRVLSGKFPDSVKAVVYQPSQFQPVSNGTINTVKVTAETIECVDRALAGEDYSNGALYFMNRRASGSAASWFDRRLTYLFAHDGHEFFR